MTASWQIQYSVDGTLVDADVSWRNMLGAPVLSASRVATQASGSDTALSGVFRFTMVSATTVSVEAVHYGDLNSPTLYSGTRTVVCNNVTGNLNLIPGLSIVFASTAVTGNEFEVGVGCYWDTTNSVWVRMLPFDFVLALATSPERILYATNKSASVQCNTQVVVTNAMRVENTQAANRPFFAFRQTGQLNPTADTDLLGRAITFTDLIPGSPNTVTVLVDGVGIDIYDVTNDATLSDGIGVKCDGTTVYRFADTTDLRSGEFLLSTATAATDTATIYTSDGGDFVEISDGLTAFAAGSSPIYLTTEGAPEGAVAVNDAVQLKLRMVCPSGKTAAMNQRSFSIRIQSEGA